MDLHKIVQICEIIIIFKAKILKNKTTLKGGACIQYVFIPFQAP